MNKNQESKSAKVKALLEELVGELSGQEQIELLSGI